MSPEQPPQGAGPDQKEPEGRPPDVDTGFWLWVIALPLLVAGYIADLVGGVGGALAGPLLAMSVLFVLILAAVVLTFSILMRHGYRWARTVLTGGAVASVVFVARSLFTVDRPPVVAVIYAVTTIIGSVLIAGGMFLLHRKDTQAFFTR
ncbi:hypothetical protein [Mycolicibacterium sp. XJ1819]